MKEALVAEKHEYRRADSPVKAGLIAKAAQMCGFPPISGTRMLHTRLEVYTLRARLSLITGDGGVACDGMRSNEHLRPMRCPECGTKIGVDHPRYPSFACPSCGTEICAAPRYLFMLWSFTVVFSFAGAYLIGLRWLTLIVVGALASRLLASFATSIGLIVVPPRIERFRLHSFWRLYGTAGSRNRRSPPIPELHSKLEKGRCSRVLKPFSAHVSTDEFHHSHH